MSKWFRAELFGCPNMTDSVMEGKLDYHMCGSWNLSSVESRFMQTPLYMRVPASRLAKTKHLQYFWSQKGDCQKSNDDARAGIGFNLANISRNFCNGLEKAKSLQQYQGHIN